jgi:hypothetical protein
MLPTPKLRYPDVAGQPMHKHPQERGTPGSGYGHPRGGRAHPMHGHNQMHRGHERRHHRRKPWYVPNWMWEMQMMQLEEEQQMMLQMGGLSMGGMGGNMGMDGGATMDDSGSDLEMPSDASDDWQNQLSTPPDLADQHNRHHKHHKHKRSGEDAMSGRGGDSQSSAQDEGIKGQDSPSGSNQAQPQSGGYSGGFSGQSPVSQSAMNQTMQPNTFKKPTGMDQGALQSSDYATSQDVAQAGPYDDMSTGYEQQSVNQASPYDATTDSTFSSLSDPNYQPNPWGFGSG